MRTADALNQRSLQAAFVAAALLIGPPAPAAAQEPLGVPAASTTVDSLVALGRLQEAVWAARAAGDTVRSDTLLARLEALLRSEPHSVEPVGLDSQGVSYTFHLHHPGGVESIFKVDGSDVFCRICGTDREVASYRVDVLLGLDLTPMVVERRIAGPAGDTLYGSAMYFVHDAIDADELAAAKPDALRFFDAVIGNSDRHPSNWLILPDGRPVAIDHNRAFQFGPVSGATTCWETEVDSIMRPGRLGRAFGRFRTLPDDSLAAAVAALDPPLVDRFLTMRSRVVDRIERRAAEPERPLPHDDCSATAAGG